MAAMSPASVVTRFTTIPPPNIAWYSRALSALIAITRRVLRKQRRNIRCIATYANTNPVGAAPPDYSRLCRCRGYYAPGALPPYSLECHRSRRGHGLLYPEVRLRKKQVLGRGCSLDAKILDPVHES